jgi:hypothetical protein
MLGSLQRLVGGGGGRLRGWGRVGVDHAVQCVVKGRQVAFDLEGDRTRGRGELGGRNGVLSMSYGGAMLVALCVGARVSLIKLEGKGRVDKWISCEPKSYA